ncbi:hypothetical protein HELRODRAFT_164987 [Helobdella robusta]|uniref:Uncharacterized protein n=1 Tax=Helobdella robusta TaxID=6412 RepID=T1EW27_HELRO|nr:hypothetical protein HELRODRAFT_164987 [Helobdella robusta]ESN92856.1 hypothetical protein HELRODRAFT_164987 [Helobdella robusta]
MAARTIHADDLLCFLFNFRVEAENLKVLENIKQLYSVKELVNLKKSLISHVESLLESEKLKLVPQGNTKDAEIQEIFQDLLLISNISLHQQFNKKILFQLSRKRNVKLKTLEEPTALACVPNQRGKLLKKVYFVSNLADTVNNETLTEYLKTNKFKVISCFEAKSHLGKGFRICIDINNSDSIFTDSALWDEDTIIREWVFKPNNNIDKKNKNEINIDGKNEITLINKQKHDE